MTSEVKLKTGGDPRSLPDYAALRDEISKLTHPARPDVDWRYVETLCLRLYEHNGVELQTASWYTIARMHTTGLSGLNEGLALIAALTRHHWSVMLAAEYTLPAGNYYRSVQPSAKNAPGHASG